MLCYSLVSYRRNLGDVKSGSSGLSLRSDNLESGGELYTEDDFREPFAAVELSIAKGTGPIAFDARGGGTSLFIPNRMLKEQLQFYRKSERITELSEPIILVRTSTSPSYQRSRANSPVSVSAIL